MSVNQKEIDQMNRLKQIMEGNFCDTIMDNIDAPIGATPSNITESTASAKDQDVNAMKEILSRFYAGVNSHAADATRDSDRMLVEAIQTNPTEHGVQLGEWEIVSISTEGIKSYNVVGGAVTIASGIAIYESAVSICRLLNDGVSITNKSFIDVLALENDYLHHRGEAIVFKKKANERRANGDYDRADIAEARYAESKANALAVREKIIAKSRLL